MGASLGILPATRNDLRSLRNDLRVEAYDLKSLLCQVDGNVRFLCDSTICPTGKQRALHSTVSINDGEAHGLLILHGENTFILTAAHVAVDFIKEDGTEVHLRWHPWTDSAESQAATIGNVFLPTNYVKDGSIDVGLIQVHLDSSSASMKAHGLRWHALEIDQDPSAEGVVVGKGSEKFHVRGQRVQSIPEKDSSRLIVHAPSKPRMSGLPLFQAKGNLVCLVHGDTKHRGGHKAAELDRPSPFLYADCICTGLTMVGVDKGYANTLSMAEEMTPEIADESHLKPCDAPSKEYRQFAMNFGTVLEMEQDIIVTTSVDDMMTRLSKQCFVQEQTVTIGDVILVASNEKSGEFVH